MDKNQMLLAKIKLGKIYISFWSWVMKVSRKLYDFSYATVMDTMEKCTTMVCESLEESFPDKKDEIEAIRKEAGL